MSGGENSFELDCDSNCFKVRGTNNYFEERNAPRFFCRVGDDDFRETGVGRECFEVDDDGDALRAEGDGFPFEAVVSA